MAKTFVICIAFAVLAAVCAREVPADAEKKSEILAVMEGIRDNVVKTLGFENVDQAQAALKDKTNELALNVEKLRDEVKESFDKLQKSEVVQNMEAKFFDTLKSVRENQPESIQNLLLTVENTLQDLKPKPKEP